MPSETCNPESPGWALGGIPDLWCPQAGKPSLGTAGITGRQAALTRDGGKSLKDIQPHLESGWVLTPLDAPALTIL